MYRRGHYGITLLLTTPVMYILGLETRTVVLGVLFTGIALTTCMLPDIDLKLPLIQHRGITHTVGFALVTAVLFGVIAIGILSQLHSLSGKLTVYGFGFAFFCVFTGIIGHLLGDALTIGRDEYAITPLWPLSDRQLRFGLTRASSPVWNNGLFILGVLAHVVILVHFGIIPTAT